MHETPEQAAVIPLRNTCKVPVEWLDFDSQNPRLVGTHQSGKEEQIIAQLYRSEELSELLQSISANGYLDIEPLIVELHGSGKLTVLEGNRRLAAIRLFHEPDLVEKIRTSQRLSITVPELPEEYRQTLSVVSVYRVPDREDGKRPTPPPSAPPHASGHFAVITTAEPLRWDRDIRWPRSG